MGQPPFARWAAAGGGLLLAAASVLHCHGERAARAAALERWAQSGAAERHPQQLSRARRDPDPGAAGPALARVLLTDAFETRSLASLPRAEAAAEARRAAERLRLAAELSRDGLAARPASWTAAMGMGGARLLASWRAGEAELYGNPRAWRAPLAHAARLAPGSPEPPRLLVIGYLATWQALSSEERAAGRRLVKAAFGDRETMRQLLPAWAAVAGSRAELEAVLPVEPEPYQLLQEAAARQRDWAGVCAARARWLPLAMAALRAQLERAEARFSGGDERGGTADLIAVAAAAPPDRRTAPLFAAAIERLPPTQVSPAHAPALAAWLRWALPLWQLGEQPLPAPVLLRLSGLSPELPPAQAAMAALAAGDLARAEVWERRADRLWSEEWAPYATAKAEVLLARGHVDEAGIVLDEVHRSYRQRWAYLRARERLAGARSQPAEVRPESLAAVSWGGEQWLYQGGEAALEVVAARPSASLLVHADGAPDGGGVVELVWDGLGIGCFAVRAGEALQLSQPVASGPHRLVWRTLAGGRTAPGAVELLPAAGP
jgi:hypothetical protein